MTKLRRAKKEDMMFLFELRNDIVVKQSAFNTKLIDLETHRQWFSRKLTDGDTTILIAENNSDKIGQIRFDIDRKTGVAEVDIAVMAACRGKGYGAKILKMGCKYVLKKLHIKKIIAHIKPRNEISVKTFSTTGFSNCGCVDYKAQKCIEMLLENE